MENHNTSGGATSDYKVKLMCSYGGKIQPRPHDYQLTYVGGDTKILAVDRNIKFPDILAKLNSLCNCDGEACFKYQLPGEDLDALVSVIDDDDLEHMMVEYDRIHLSSPKPARLRLFLFSLKRSISSGLDDLKTGRATPAASLIPDFLFGFDKEYEYHQPSPSPIPKFVIPQIPGVVVPVSDPAGGAEMQTLIQGIAGQGLVVLPDAFSRDSHVTTGSYPAQLVYGIPVPAGGYRAGVGQRMQRVVPGIFNPEQPVYAFLPVMPSAEEQKVGEI